MLYVHTHILIVFLSHPYCTTTFLKSPGGPGGGHQGRRSRGSVEQVPFFFYPPSMGFSSPKSHGKLVGFDGSDLEDPFFKWMIWGYPHFRSF